MSIAADERAAVVQILVDGDNSNCGNLGDLAMLQMTLQRLHELWPDAQIQVLTGVPERLLRHYPSVKPVHELSRYTWLTDRYLLGPLHRILTTTQSRKLGNLKRTLEQRWPRLMQSIIGAKASLRQMPHARPEAFASALPHATLLVVCGLGAMTDSAIPHSQLVLDTLAMAQAYGVPCAMMSQGIGPLMDAELWQQASAVLPAVALIGVRERLNGPALLRQLGVPPAQIVVSGDDALELAYIHRPEQLGEALGINVRIAAYAGTDSAVLAPLRAVLHTMAERYGVPLLPVPITLHTKVNDIQSLQALGIGDGGSTLDTPVQVIEQIGRCRIVITGAYHAAVFALAQGVPAICLVGSDYYAHKFAGLADLFGVGCVTVALHEPELEMRLSTAIDQCWEQAPHIRAAILDAAREQIALNRAAYQQVLLLVNSHAAVT